MVPVEVTVTGRANENAAVVIGGIKSADGIYRKPSQARGMAKFKKILDAAHVLIGQKLDESFSVHEISLYDIASQAGVATGSVYHFFPNMDALYVALVEFYDEQFAEIIRQPIPSDKTDNWQDILITHTGSCRKFANSHKAALWLIMGPGRTWQSKQVDTLGDIQIAQAMVESHREYFALPTNPAAEKILHYAIRVLEGFWELSYQMNGYVNDEFAAEADKAMISYIKLYWPQHLEKSYSITR